MNNEQLDKVLSYLDKVGEKIGATGQQIWPWLMKQQYIDAYLSLSFFILSIITFVIMMKKFIHADLSKFEYDKNDIIVIVFFVISCIFIFVSTIIFLSEFFDIFNPEYWALMNLLDKIR